MSSVTILPMFTAVDVTNIYLRMGWDELPPVFKEMCEACLAGIRIRGFIVKSQVDVETLGDVVAWLQRHGKIRTFRHSYFGTCYGIPSINGYVGPYTNSSCNLQDDEIKLVA